MITLFDSLSIRFSSQVFQFFEPKIIEFLLNHADISFTDLNVNEFSRIVQCMSGCRGALPCESIIEACCKELNSRSVSHF